MPDFPQDDESEAEFMDRCVGEMLDEEPDLNEGEAEEACSLMWDERAGKAPVRKTHAESTDGRGFVLSDESVDRMGDVILAEGWRLANFKKNPIALFGHRGDFPIGKWVNLRVEDKKLKGELELAPRGTSQRIDEIRALVDAGILRAVSVGFRPLAKPEPRDKENPWDGVLFSKQELLEASLVTVPANANALALAKSLEISRSTLDLVFAKLGNRSQTVTRGGPPGKLAATPPDRKVRAMSPLAQRITDTEQRLVSLRDQLTEHLSKSDDSNVSDDDLAVRKELNKKIATQEESLTVLKDSEQRLALASGGNGNGSAIIVRPASEPAAPAATALRPFSLAPKKLDGLELLVRSGVVQYFSHTLKEPIDLVRQKIYGDDPATRVIVDWTLKAASAPAMTSVAGWAAELVQTVNAAVMPTLTAASVYPRLSAMGLQLSFGRNGKISVPTRNTTPTVAGSFVGEGQPIPVRQAGFSAVSLVPKKMAVITTWTREIDEHSVPAIEGLLREAIQQDTATSLDAVLLDANPATTVRPAGLRNGVASLTPTAGGGFTALVGDIKQITAALLTATAGNIRTPAWLMNPQQALSISLTQAPSAVGVFPFAAEIQSGNLRGWPVIVSGTVPTGTVIALDAADFVSVSGDNPRFEVSDQATLHMEDTTPVQIGTVGTPAVVAAPAMSLWQTDSIGLRLILPVNWAVRRAGVVSWVAGVTW